MYLPVLYLSFCLHFPGYAGENYQNLPEALYTGKVKLPILILLLLFYPSVRSWLSRPSQLFLLKIPLLFPSLQSALILKSVYFLLRDFHSHEFHFFLYFPSSAEPPKFNYYFCRIIICYYSSSFKSVFNLCCIKYIIPIILLYCIRVGPKTATDPITRPWEVNCALTTDKSENDLNKFSDPI